MPLKALSKKWQTWNTWSHGNATFHPRWGLCVEHWAPDPAIEGAEEPPNQIGGARGRLCFARAEWQKWQNGDFGRAAAHSLSFTFGLFILAESSDSDNRKSFGSCNLASADSNPNATVQAQSLNARLWPSWQLVQWLLFQGHDLINPARLWRR
ncbi:hypothetical protein I7I51_01161 [Histoplasma capsulatum]|uniref:Uncharacterized protein n=1 Tax=Ajellomyces capsulatus TaxID=5037 RepID=A0A8A1MDT0_AJECA|nr:hypothetical protein I7I51_01161 [Histoplasma capsulatum]